MRYIVSSIRQYYTDTLINHFSEYATTIRNKGHEMSVCGVLAPEAGQQGRFPVLEAGL